MPKDGLDLLDRSSAKVGPDPKTNYLKDNYSSRIGLDPGVIKCALN